MHPCVPAFAFAALTLGLSPIPPTTSTPATGVAGALHGRYVEARTASVFAGACHYGSEATTDGREALLAFHFDGGVREGVDLTGGDIVALVHGDANLADPRTARRSVLYVPKKLSQAAQDALVAIVRQQCASALGSIVAVRCVDLDVALGVDRYAVHAQNLFELRGATLPDRACCKMPYNVWYTPFVAVDAPIVGLNAEFACTDKTVGAVWSRPDENASFVGSFTFSTRPRR